MPSFHDGTSSNGVSSTVSRAGSSHLLEKSIGSHIDANDTWLLSSREEGDVSSSLITSSLILEEILETCQEGDSTLETYKDILNERIKCKTKIPLPSSSSRKADRSIVVASPQGGRSLVSVSKLPVSVSSRRLSMLSPRVAVTNSPSRSVSDSPLKSRFPVHSMTRDSDKPRTKELMMSERRRKGLSMMLPSSRLVSEPLKVPSNHLKQEPSYLKQTTSSLKRMSLISRENKENQLLTSPKISRSPSMLIKDTKMKRSTRLELDQDHLKRVTMSPQKIDTLNVTKVRLQKSNHDLDKHTSSRMTRSQTHQQLSSITQPLQAKPMLKTLDTKIRDKHFVRTTSITSSKKISTLADLYKAISNAKLVRTWEKIHNHKFAKIDAVVPSDLQKHSRFKLLNNYERGEILRKSEIFYVGDKRKPEVELSNYSTNFGFDDAQNNYLIESGDHILYRFRVLSKLGNGAFGAVVACNDYKLDQVCAVKIVRNEMTCSLQAVNEVKILKKLSAENSENSHILQYFCHLNFRGHMCISAEYLPLNLFQVLENSNFKGFSMSVISKFASQILTALDFLHTKIGIIHCDLKPENLMLTSPYSFDLKLIDFGSAVYINDISYSYLQSRFYRAPEVALGARYNEKIDIWSCAALLVELFTGLPLFPCDHEAGLMIQYLDSIGCPKPDLIVRLRKEVLEKGSVGDSSHESSLLWHIFDSKGHLLKDELERRSGKRLISIDSRNLRSILMAHASTSSNLENQLLDLFVDFCGKCLVWDYWVRANAETLLSHEFLTLSK